MARAKGMPLQGVLVIGAVLAIAGFFVGRATAPKPAAKAGVGAAAEARGGAHTASQPTYVEKRLVTEPSPSKGPADAPVVMFEVSDFQCPFCGRAWKTVEQVMEAYPNDVRVVFKHRPLPFHKNARRAALAAAAAARQGHFWAMYDTLFANQKSLSDADIEGYAQDLGLDMAKFKADLKDPKLAKHVDADDAAAQALGITGTPGFVINGVFLKGAKPLADFKAEIDKQLVKAKELMDAGVPRAQVARRLTAQAGGQAAKVIKYFMDGYPAPKPKAAPKKGEDTKTVWKVQIDPDHDPVRGPKYAPVTIVEFSDFQCPFCGKMPPVYKKIEETYGDKVRVFFKQNPLSFHKHAQLAAEASLAAHAQGKFWEMHDLLFANQKALERADLERYAKQIGLDMAKFKAALDNHTYKAWIADDQEAAGEVKAQGTPNAYINGRQLTGAKSFEDFKAIIDQELVHAKKVMDSGVKLEDLYGKLIAKGKRFQVLDERVNTFDLSKAAIKGDKNAPITLVEFSDFQCPYCSRMVAPLEGLVAKYPAKTRFIFKQFPLSFHKNARNAARASLAAQAQGKFWEMHDIMFQNQKALDRDKLSIYAEQVGLDRAKFDAAVDSDTYEGRIKAEIAEGQRAGVRGTPSLYINGRKYNGSGRTLPDLEKILAKHFGLVVK